MKASLVAALALTLVAGGCVSPAEQRAADEGRCRSYGFRQNSDGFSGCLLELDLDRSADRRARFAESFGPYPWYGYRRW